jgi:hypothetical protein
MSISKYAEGELFAETGVTVWSTIKDLGLRRTIYRKMLTSDQESLRCYELGEAWWKMERTESGRWKRRVIADAPMALGDPEVARVFKKACQRVALKLHPDKNEGNGEELAVFNAKASALSKPPTEMAVVRAVGGFSCSAFELCNGFADDLDIYVSDMHSFVLRMRMFKKLWADTVEGEHSDLQTYEAFGRKWATVIYNGIVTVMKQQWVVDFKVLTPIRDTIPRERWSDILEFFDNAEKVNAGGAREFEAICDKFSNDVLLTAIDKSNFGRWVKKTAMLMKEAPTCTDTATRAIKESFSN